MPLRLIYFQGVCKTVDYETCFPICFLIFTVGGEEILLKHLFMPPKNEKIARTVFILGEESISVKRVTYRLNCIFNIHCIMIHQSIIVGNIF